MVLPGTNSSGGSAEICPTSPVWKKKKKKKKASLGMTKSLAAPSHPKKPVAFRLDGRIPALIVQQAQILTREAGPCSGWR
ncbi:hypothetical protein B296_00051725 [Ensete ventricosum]|uniref:Uncharacterized protein n=1 Tax=Ensete ventricosum TaxID=4639 RepID=A0A426YFE9_ENSVE|nr:hypothetical protein B296_00051725 [Ensete ventricosum]